MSMDTFDAIEIIIDLFQCYEPPNKDYEFQYFVLDQLRFRIPDVIGHIKHWVMDLVINDIMAETWVLLLNKNTQKSGNGLQRAANIVFRALQFHSIAMVSYIFSHLLKINNKSLLTLRDYFGSPILCLISDICSWWDVLGKPELVLKFITVISIVTGPPINNLLLTRCKYGGTVLHDLIVSSKSLLAAKIDLVLSLCTDDNQRKYLLEAKNIENNTILDIVIENKNVRLIDTLETIRNRVYNNGHCYGPELKDKDVGYYTKQYKCSKGQYNLTHRFDITKREKKKLYVLFDRKVNGKMDGILLYKNGVWIRKFDRKPNIGTVLFAQ
jgi:hypothetical protein